MLALLRRTVELTAATRTPISGTMALLTPQNALLRSPRISRMVVKLVFAGVIMASLALLCWPVIRGDRGLFEVLRDAALPGFMLALVLLVAVRHERRWAQSVSSMSRLLSEIRHGETPTNELAALGGGAAEMAELAERVSMLCRDLKAQRQAVRELEVEIQRRVATRTDSLERTLGDLRVKATQDALTGLGNRGAFDASFPAMLERARSERADLCVIMIDVDNFKDLNDTLGHAVGDDYLRRVGQLLRGAVREEDQAFRYGGDEFVITLWSTSEISGRATANRIGRVVDDLARTYDVPNPPRLSCGMATLGRSGRAGTPGDLLRRADEDLYRLKHARKARQAA
jgi:diguanylate cyclase (GGDEF)-like protein